MKNMFQRLLIISAILMSSLASAKQSVIHLKQSDFDSGTYRIRTPNVYVILDESIHFQPIPEAEATRTDKPVSGWFAAITVEADNVTIDLNRKTLQATQEFIDGHFFSVYSDIELDNSPFSGVLFGGVGASFIGDTEFIAANNVEIKNGTLARASHWCIHGNNNSNILIHNIYARDFAVAGIQMGGFINCIVHDVKITGNEHPVLNTQLRTGALTLISYLQLLAAQGVPGAAAHLAATEAYVDANPQLYNNPQLIAPNSMYGIIMTSGFPGPGPLPTSPASCAFTASFSGGRTLENLVIRNVYIDGITSAPTEAVLIGSPQGTPPFTIFAANLSLLLPIFGALRWLDAFDENGNFAPNPILQAQIYVLDLVVAASPGVIGAILPVNYPAIAASITVPDEAAFLGNTFPLFGLQLDTFSVKGSFGIRVDCADKAVLENCIVRNVHGVGKPGATLADIPDGNFYPPQLESRYLGNDSWGYEFSTNDGTIINNCKASKISSINGDSFGFDLAGFDANMELTNCKAKDISSFGDDIGSIVNPPTTSYGFIVEGNTGKVKLCRVKADKIIAPRFAVGFASEESTNVQFINATAKNIAATSSKDLTAEKDALGFELASAASNVLRCIRAHNIRIIGEKDAQQSNSVADGIFIDAHSIDNAIVKTAINEIDGGAGEAFAIENRGQNTVIK